MAVGGVSGSARSCFWVRLSTDTRPCADEQWQQPEQVLMGSRHLPFATRLTYSLHDAMHLSSTSIHGRLSACRNNANYMEPLAKNQSKTMHSRSVFRAHGDDRSHQLPPSHAICTLTAMHDTCLSVLVAAGGCSNGCATHAFFPAITFWSACRSGGSWQIKVK